MALLKEHFHRQACQSLISAEFDKHQACCFPFIYHNPKEIQNDIILSTLSPTNNIFKK